jgi:hypothetical protein
MRRGPDDWDEWTHRIPLRHALTGGEKELLNLLQHVVTLRIGAPLEPAIALAMYQDAASSADPALWTKTAVGQLFHAAKYLGDTTALADLANELASFLSAHPDYTGDGPLVAVPSHSPSRFSERLVAQLGKLSGRPVTSAREVDGSGLPVKGMTLEERGTQRFAVDSAAVRGRRVVVVDDMAHTGASLASVGAAAIEAGANHVSGLVAVRTMRN